MPSVGRRRPVLKRTEHVEQREFVSWFRKSYPGVKIIAIPNGGKRSKTEAMRLKVEGVTAGVYDLFIPAWLLWVEFKLADKTKARVSKDQKAWGRYVESIGHKQFVAYGLEDAKTKIEHHLQQSQDASPPDQ